MKMHSDPVAFVFHPTNSVRCLSDLTQLANIQLNQLTSVTTSQHLPQKPDICCNKLTWNTASYYLPRPSNVYLN